MIEVKVHDRIIINGYFRHDKEEIIEFTVEWDKVGELPHIKQTNVWEKEHK